MRLRLLVSLLVAVACKSGDPEAAANAGAARAPAAETSAPLPAPAPAPEALPPTVSSSDREAGGRPLGWWQDRLTTLHREGPADLYQLALQRARANGLEVSVGAGGAIGVRFAPEERKP